MLAIGYNGNLEKKIERENVHMFLRFMFIMIFYPLACLPDSPVCVCSGSVYRALNVLKVRQSVYTVVYFADPTRDPQRFTTERFSCCSCKILLLPLKTEWFS